MPMHALRRTLVLLFLAPSLALAQHEGHDMAGMKMDSVSGSMRIAAS